jgi:hypothetical protein
VSNFVIKNKVVRKDNGEIRTNETIPKQAINKPHYISSKVARNINNMKSIHLAGDKFLIREEAPVNSYQTTQFPAPDLPGVYFRGMQYYDLKEVHFLNNTGIANLIELLKSLLEKDVEVRFVNVSDKIKNKIKTLELDQILICI